MSGRPGASASQPSVLVITWHCLFRIQPEHWFFLRKKRFHWKNKEIETEGEEGNRVLQLYAMYFVGFFLFVSSYNVIIAQYSWKTKT